MSIYPGKLDCNRSHSRLHTIRAIFIIGILLSAAIAQAQSPAVASYPEVGWLTRSTYCNPYFGIRLDLPDNLRIERIHLPVQLDGRHMLLAMHLWQLDRSADLFLSAFEDYAPNPAQRAARSRQRDAHAASLSTHGPKELRIHEHSLYRLNVVNPNGGSDAETSYYFAIRGWVLHVVILASDDDLVSSVTSAVEHLEFLDSTPPSCALDPAQLDASVPPNAIAVPASSAKSQPGAIAAPVKPAAPADPPASHEDPHIYYGPSLPTALVESTLREAPGNSIPSGEFSNAIFKDPEVGIRFHLPRGWRPMPAEEAYRVTELMRDPIADPDAGDRRRELFRACSRVLFSAADPASELISDVHPAVAIVAMPQGCIPDLVLPRPDDFAAAEDFANILARSLGAFLLRRGHIQQLTSGRSLFQLDGALPYQLPGEMLSRRLSLRVTATTSGRWLIFVCSVAASPAAQREIESRIFLTQPTQGFSAWANTTERTK